MKWVKGEIRRYFGPFACSVYVHQMLFVDLLYHKIATLLHTTSQEGRGKYGRGTFACTKVVSSLGQ